MARLLYDVLILPAGRRGDGFDPDAVAMTQPSPEIISGSSKLAS